MLIDFLSDALLHMDDFRDDISTAYVFEESPGNYVATGNHPKRFLFYRVEPQTSLTTELEAPAYLGALPYLRSMLSSSLMKEEPKLELSYLEKAGKKHAVKSMRFTAKRFDANFQCTDPGDLKDKDRIRQFPRPTDAVFFPITKKLRKEFDEVARFGTPKADMRLFTLSYDGGYVRAKFGGGSHSSTFVLTNEVSGNTDTNFSKSVSLDRFRLMMKLASENENGKGAFHQSAVWVDFNTSQSVHIIATPTIREQIR